MPFINLRRAALAAPLALLAFAAAAAEPHGITILGAPPQQPAAQTPAGAHATRKLPTVTVDADAAGRAPYQAQALLSLASPVASFTIPAGYRLVVEEVNIGGTAGGGTGPTQPIVLAYPYTAANGQVPYYFATNPSTIVSGIENQYYADFPVHQYAESYGVGLGFAGYPPSFMSFNVTVSGHLIAITAP
jgi:hypothetical protein